MATTIMLYVLPSFGRTIDSSIVTKIYLLFPTGDLFFMFLYQLEKWKMFFRFYKYLIRFVLKKKKKH